MPERSRPPSGAPMVSLAMRRVLMDPVLRADLRARGLRRVKEFSWDRSVGRIHQIYEEVLAG